MGGAVDNEGTINANLGKIGIGAGKEITLDLSGDKFLQVSIPFSEAITLLDQNAEELNTIINHAGTSTANRIDIDVGAAKNVVQRAVNIPGNLVATTASQQNGVITLGSGSDIVVSGNMYNSEVETPRNDASVGVYLKFTPDFGFEAVPTQKSGLFINGDVKDMEFISFNENEYIISAKNDDLIEFTKIK